MEQQMNRFRGCLLGMAVGDAMGAAVEKKSYEEICETYGPAGLLGYDTVNGLAEITSYTQVAAFAVNGLLLAISKGQSQEAMAYTVMALKEWASVQHFPKDPHRRNCWLRGTAAFRRRKCMDPRTLDALTRDALGTPRRPANQAEGPGSLTVAVAMGLYFHPERMQFHQIGVLGAQTVALTHGEPATFLCGGVLAYVIAAILNDPEGELESHFRLAAQTVADQFGGEFPQALRLRKTILDTVEKAKDPAAQPVAVMESIGCNTCVQVLCGAMYAVLAGRGDFDTSAIIAVNHSGKSAAVGAVTGAILGALLGEESLPEFYLECLEAGQVLQTLATDLWQCYDKPGAKRLFDMEWDRKYTHGLPVERDGWNEEV